MLPVKKKTIEVSYVETKDFIIRVPAFIIPLHYLKITGIFICCSLLFLLSTSYESPKIKRFIKQENIGIVEVAGLEPREKYFIQQSEQSEQSEQKMIPITEIISDEKVLNFICTNRVLERAYKVQQETGLKVATIIGQKGVESAWNNSSLCKKTKNYGNIKCFKKHNHVNAGCVRAYDKKEGSNDWYVKANTNWEGWAIYKELIDRKFTKAANQDDVYNQIVWLKKKRYASDPNYVSIIWNTIRKYNLLKLQEYIEDGYTITSETGKYIFLKPTP